MKPLARVLLPGAAASLLLVLAAACGAAPSASTTADSATATSVAEAGPAVSDIATYATWQDSRISESSGLSRVGDVLLTVNDQGDPAVIYASQGTSGEVTGTITYAAADPFDVEGVAAAPDGSIWVADTGDNARVRADVTLFHVPASDLEGDVTASATAHTFTFPDGCEDAEAVLVHPTTGEVLLVTKDSDEGTVYAASTGSGSGTVRRLEPVATVMASVSDGVFAPDGTSVILRNGRQATVYAYPSWEVLGVVDLPDEPKGEGLTTGAEKGTYLTSSEGVGTAVLSWLLGPTSS